MALHQKVAGMPKKQKNIKISSTAYRVLLILHLLNQGKYTLDELSNQLSNDENISRTFSKEVIIKYINTLRVCGFEINKSMQANVTYYELKKAPFLIKFEEDEIKTLAILQNHINYLYQPLLISSFNAAVEKISKYIPAQKHDLLEKFRDLTLPDISDKYSHFANLIKQLEQLCVSRQSISVTYCPLKGICHKIVFEPEKIEYLNQKVYIYGYNPKIYHKQYLLLDYIQEIKQLPTIYNQINSATQVTFRLTGRVARAYRLYEGEEIIEKGNSPFYILVNSKVDDVNVLLHRLLRYGHFCEVITPVSARKKICEIIDDLRNNYERKLA